MKRKNITLARKLRKNMTEAEKKLWRYLRNKNLGVKFRRQEPVGDYIVDFICYERRLIIEIDGSQHYDSKRDRVRDGRLRKEGYRVLRFWNNEVLSNIEGVLEVINKALLPSPYPSPSRERDNASP